MATNPMGLVRDGFVWVENTPHASRIFQKGAYGKLIAGEGLRLELEEAIWLVQSDRLQLDVPLAQVHALLGVDSYRARRNLVYQDLRKRSLETKFPSAETLEVTLRGKSQPTPVHVCSERDLLGGAPLDPGTLFSVVTGEAEVRHYLVSAWDKRGKYGDPKAPVKAAEMGDFLLIPTSKDLLDLGYGRITELGHLLGQDEARYLNEIGVLQTKLPAQVPDPFSLYRDLRKRGFVPRSGLTFGVDFRVYDDDMNAIHAPYLVQLLQSGTTWAEIARAVRLAGGVRKQFLLAKSGETLVYRELQHTRP